MKIQLLLVSSDLGFRDMDQSSNFSVVVAGADVLHDFLDAALGVSDLYGRCSGAGLHFPHEQPHPNSLVGTD